MGMLLRRRNRVDAVPVEIPEEKVEKPAKVEKPKEAKPKTAKTRKK